MSNLPSSSSMKYSTYDWSNKLQWMSRFLWVVIMYLNRLVSLGYLISYFCVDFSSPTGVVKRFWPAPWPYTGIFTIFIYFCCYCLLGFVSSFSTNLLKGSTKSSMSLNVLWSMSFTKWRYEIYVQALFSSTLCEKGMRVSLMPWRK